MESELSKITDYSQVPTAALVATYDDLKSAPRITKVEAGPTDRHIEELASTVYEQSHLLGGNIPYTVIREVTENFIHAQFKEVVVSILDEGQTIRFADQGPGIEDKEKAQKPGFTSAVEPMKDYIRGVGSGLPIVREYLDERRGSIVIEDNLVSGAVVTISTKKTSPPRVETTDISSAPSPKIPLSQRELDFLLLFAREGDLGVTDIVRRLETPNSTTYSTLTKLEDAGLIEKSYGKKRAITDFGTKVLKNLGY